MHAKKRRQTTQLLLPSKHEAVAFGQYDLYPAFSLGNGKIELGYHALAARIIRQKQVIIDGYVGIFWDDLRASLDAALHELGVAANWVDVSQVLLPPDKIEALVAPFLGGDDPIFGTRFTGTLGDFFDQEKLSALQGAETAVLNIIYGCGAALAGWEGLLVYVDLPKNELQFRSRAGAVTNLGSQTVIPPKPMYKRFYFVDWIALNQHKAEHLPNIDLIVDGQRPTEPTFMGGDDFRAGLTTMSQNYFRVRPWFEPGPWGGQWIKEKMPQLPQDVPNYAWSFELIVPENGLIFESDGRLLEASFDCLMYHNHRAVLGHCADRFGYEFPIRFDFLDTFDGGNLSVQCHPRPAFIREQFGETFTQDETYYILDCGSEAQVYLGFQAGIDPAKFRAELERSLREGTEIDVEKYVNVEPAHKHDLFLIPNGTIHCSGIDNLVLEISATPYIFTFKLYDWLRLDLEGKPRPLNIERAFQNLYFDRQGARVQAELIAKPSVIAQGDGWQLLHLPTHPDHFYDVHRFEFDDAVAAHTDGSPHIMSLVEGEAITLETANGLRQTFSYAETFVVPAAANSYRLINEGSTQAWVVKAFMKKAAA
ncbi:class I mannose-6-phosphate isomerase [Candidatus Leptofilum sp.]|uniref:class I mannose-6-phosphate isomerase n=1 Tax=Candidatus Leptofilum sp. TaxID=3241576 RepID=UPI003B59D10E